jgi:hypothetical protein
LEVVEQGNLYALVAESNLYDRIVTPQRDDEGVQQIKQKSQKGAKDVIWLGKRLVIPADPDLKKEIFDEGPVWGCDSCDGGHQKPKIPPNAS